MSVVRTSLGAALACLLIIAAACTSPKAGPDPASSAWNRQPQAAKATASNRPWYADRLEKLGFTVFPTPVDVGDISVEALSGGKSNLSAAKGKIVLLNFWATWCPPCRQEMPSIEALWNKTRNEAFTIYAVSMGETKATVKKYIEEQKYSYPIFIDPENRIGTSFNVNAIPTSYILDKAGRAIAGTQGAHEYGDPDFLAIIADLASR
jgi:thiol-disulfide isomerase/thioredoxin